LGKETKNASQSRLVKPGTRREIEQTKFSMDAVADKSVLGEKE
jgi:hypothetical protein